jgi:cysteinyl-tRNA synthetase
MKYTFLILLFIQTGCTVNSKILDQKSWYYKLQNYNSSDFTQVKDSSIVIDLYKSINPTKVFSNKRLNKLKSNNNKIFAYFSIGEAEDYRPNFKEIPKNIIGKENKNWKGNFNINYWDKRWHKLVLNYLTIIEKQGFDGVYLDIIDAFHRYPNKKKAAKQMLELIKIISDKSKETNKQFKIILQNGIDITDYLDEKEKALLLTVIDGVAIEDYLFQNNKLTQNNEILKYLDFYRGKLKLSVEYSLSLKERQKYFNLCQKYMLIPLITDKNLKGKFYIFK